MFGFWVYGVQLGALPLKQVAHISNEWLGREIRGNVNVARSPTTVMLKAEARFTIPSACDTEETLNHQ